jgi:hypothetical protein
MPRIAATLILVITVAAGPASADPRVDYVESRIGTLTGSPVVMESVRQANERHGDLSADGIAEMDQAWQAEIGTASTPTISAVHGNAASEELRQLIAESEGRIAEIIVMDVLGLNAAISGVTSDYWQGDEAKHQETYGAGPEGVHISEIEYDQSTGLYQVQVSRTLVDAASGEPVGAVTFGLDASLF